MPVTALPGVRRGGSDITGSSLRYRAAEDSVARLSAPGSISLPLGAHRPAVRPAQNQYLRLILTHRSPMGQHTVSRVGPS